MEVYSDLNKKLP